MRKLIESLFVFALLQGVVFARARVQGWCTEGNQTLTVVVAGVSGTTAATPAVNSACPSATVTVYLTGTTNLATLFADNSGTPKANPFTLTPASTPTDGIWFFYADDGRYDVKFSGTGVATPFTLSDWLAFDVVAPSFSAITASTSVTSPIFASNNADPADSGIVRLGNNEAVAWEANPTGTDLTLKMDTNNVLTSSVPINATTGFRIGNAAASTDCLRGNGTNFVQSSSGCALYSDNLSVFAATTSAQLAGVLSDETGTGVAVFSTSPTFTTGITTPKVTSADANPATSGAIRLGNTELLGWRNAAHSADFTLGLNASNVLATTAPFQFTTYISSSVGSPASTGAIRLGNNEILGWRNSTNSGDDTLVANGSDVLTSSVKFSAPTLVSTVATGTAPLTVASTTNVANLNASSLNGATFSAPGAIGGGTPGTAAFTTISATGQITSTLAPGTAPFVVASTTNVANLNASSLSGATFASPGAIGGSTPSTGAFTTISATGVITSTLATGTAPFTIASTTPVTNLAATPTTYNHSGTQLANVHIVEDTCTLGTSCAVTLVGAAVFTSSTSYTCTIQDQTGANSTAITQSSGSAFTITGTGTDVLRYICIGN